MAIFALSYRTLRDLKQQSLWQTLATLRDFSASLSRLVDHNTYLYAVNGQRMERCMGIRNRLIK